MEPFQLDELLGGEGRLDSSGAFTVDVARARIKLSRYSMAADMYLAKLVQAGIAAGSQHIQIGQLFLGLGSEVVVRFHAPDCKQLSLEAIAKGLEEPLSLPQESAAAQLCMGILASQYPRPRRVVWRLSEPGRCDWVEVNEGEVRCGSSDRNPGSALAVVRLADPSQPELARVRELFGYSPVPIQIDNQVLEGAWGQEERDDWGPLYRLGEHYAFADKGDRLGVPVRETAWVVDSSGRRRGTGPGVAHLGYLEGELPPRHWACESTLAIPVRLHKPPQPSRLLLVRHGMRLQEKTISLPCPRVLAVAAARGLQLDLSGQVVEDEAYQALVEKLRARTRVLLGELAGRLSDLHVPKRGRGALELGTSALGVGGLGLRALVAVFPQFGVPVLLGGSAAGLAGAALVYGRAARHWDPEASARVREEFRAM